MQLNSELLVELWYSQFLYYAVMSCDSISTKFPVKLSERVRLGLTSRNLFKISQVLLIIFNDNVCFHCY